MELETEEDIVSLLDSRGDPVSKYAAIRIEQLKLTVEHVRARLATVRELVKQAEGTEVACYTLGTLGELMDIAVRGAMPKTPEAFRESIRTGFDTEERASQELGYTSKETVTEDWLSDTPTKDE